MEISWKNLVGEHKLSNERKINLEYAVRLQVVKILIKEAEHLMNYLPLIIIEIDPSNGHVSVHDETPEPLFSKIANNLEQPLINKVPNVSSPLLAVTNF